MNAEETKDSSPGQHEEVNRIHDSGVEVGTEETKDQEIVFGTRKSKINRWVPHRWEEWYNQVVILSTLGLKSNTELAAIYKCTPPHISNILNTPQAAVIRKTMHDSVLKDMEAVNSIETITQKAMDRIRRVLNNDELFEKNTALVAGIAMKLIDRKFAASQPAAQSGNINVGSAIIFSSQDGDAMRAAIQKSKDADLINKDKPIEPPLRLLKNA